MFVFFTVFYFSRFLPAITESSEGGERWFAGFVILSLATLQSGIFAITAFLVQKYRFWRVNLFTYVLEVGLGQTILFLFSPVVSMVLRSQLRMEYSAPVTLTVPLFIAALSLVLGLLALMHHGERQILNRLKNADDLASKLESDRRELLQADEQLREQIVRILHDRVQSELMVSSMMLRNVAISKNHADRLEIEAVISGLEKLRTGDLRELISVLAPNFEASGFQGALMKFSEQYRDQMKIHIQVDAASEKLPTTTLIGIYRIIEQSLLNALVHGPAKNVQVTVECKEAGLVQFSIADDGPGESTAIQKAGVGTAVIDSWVSVLGGSKTIESAIGHGYLLRVDFFAS